jgi:hypothetical protein
MIRPLLVVILGLAIVGRGVGAIYYVDSDSGIDSSTGLSPHQAWKGLERVNKTTFRGGDEILFKRGTRYAGQLQPHGCGQAGDPIIVASYGMGDKPRIDGEGKVLDTVLIRNVEYWQISDLEVTNQGPQREPWRTGVRVLAENYGTMHQIHLKNLYVHDVNGDLRKSHEGCGIFFEAKGGEDSHFDDLLIENCHLVRTDRNGICQRRSGSAGRSVKVVIRGNLLEDIGGDAIKPWGSNGALVEHNTVRGGRMRCEDAAAGIWPWDCDDTVIQCNEVSGMKGTRDGQAFDSDYRCRNTLFQYNYSHDNDGGFMLICTPGNSYCEGTVIRYNVSQNDGVNTARVFHFGGGPRNTRIYNNVIYVAPGRDLPLLLFTEWSGGHAENTYFYNNIFYVDGKINYQWGKSKNNVFEKNVFCGSHNQPPADPHAVTSRPPLVDPGSGTHGRESLGGYLLREPTEELKGRVVENNGGRDFFGNPVPENQPPVCGVHQPR